MTFQFKNHDTSTSVINSNAMSTQTTCPGKIAVVMSRLMTFSSETVLLNCAAILASVSFSDTCDHPKSKLVSTHQCQNTLVEKHFGLKKTRHNDDISIIQLKQITFVSKGNRLAKITYLGHVNSF